MKTWNVTSVFYEHREVNIYERDGGVYKISISIY